MTTGNESQGSHFAHQVGEAMIVRLMGYGESGVVSRSFMLEEYGKVLEEIHARSGSFKSCSENELALAECRIYVELV